MTASSLRDHGGNPKEYMKKGENKIKAKFLSHIHKSEHNNRSEKKKKKKNQQFTGDPDQSPSPPLLVSFDVVVFFFTPCAL